MSEKRALKLYKLGLTAKYNKTYDQAIKFFDEALTIYPEYVDALNKKAVLLVDLGRLEEGYQILFKSYVIKLKKSGDIPSDINSIEAWLNGAKELRKVGNEDRALDFLMQAAAISPIVDKEGGLVMHHSNPAIYYEMGLGTFTFLKKYNQAMEFFNKAIKYDSTLTIPEGIKTVYNEYLANRSGVGVKMIAPLNASNLRDLIPTKDIILASTTALGESRQGNMTGSKTRIYRWNSHLLLCDNGIAFQGAKPMCMQPTYYLPWESIGHKTQIDSFLIPPLPYKILNILFLRPILDPQTNSYKYLEDLNLIVLVEKKHEELLRRTVVNLKSLEKIPSYENYIQQVEFIFKPAYQKVVKVLKKERKKK